MGGHAERMVEQAVAALVSSDLTLARKVVAGRRGSGQTQREIDDKAILLIAKRQPLAADLREIIGAIRISADLERVGDLGKNVAKRVVAIGDIRQPAACSAGLQALAELALTQLKDVLDVYASRAVERIAFVRDRDDQIDAMYTSLFRELLTYMMEDRATSRPARIFCSAPRTSSGSATTPPTSPRRSIMCSPASRCRPTGRRKTVRIPSCWRPQRRSERAQSLSRRPGE
jgi:phosphate transport system protein